MLTDSPLITAASCLPVTVLNGFTGAGKTTLLHHLLRQRPELRAAVIVSEPTLTPAPGRASISHTAEKVVRFDLGQGCYALRADLLLEAGRLTRENCYDYLLVENPGLAAVVPVAHTFTLGHAAYGLDLPQRTRLDTLVTVVDAGHFFHDFWALLDPPGNPDAQPLAYRADVLTEQVENANVLVINKIDRANAAELRQLRALLHHLNPRAHVVEAEFGQVRPADLLDTDLYRSSIPAGYAAPLLPDAHGIGAVRFRDERPFHPTRFQEFVRQGWPAAVLRSQGLFWLASCSDEVLNWSQAGPSRSTKTVGTWWAAVPDRDRDPGYQRDASNLRARWHPQFQDRVNTLHFIGQDLDATRLQSDLESCLCTPLEIGRWRRGIFSDHS